MMLFLKIRPSSCPNFPCSEICAAFKFSSFAFRIKDISLNGHVVAKSKIFRRFSGISDNSVWADGDSLSSSSILLFRQMKTKCVCAQQKIEVAEPPIWSVQVTSMYSFSVVSSFNLMSIACEAISCLPASTALGVQSFNTSNS